MKIQELVPVEWSNQRVLTGTQVAEVLGCSPNLIKEHFRNHPLEFVEGVHYFKLEGAALRALKAKMCVGKDLASAHSPVGKYVSCLKLWTVQGVARISKLIDTEEAWRIFTELEAVYFGKKSAPVLLTPPSTQEFDLKRLLEFLNGLADLAIKEKLIRETANLLIGKNIF